MGITSDQLAELKELAEDADQYASNNWDAYSNGPDEEGSWVMDSPDVDWQTARKMAGKT